MENISKSSWIHSVEKLSEYQISLLDWYDQNKRNLPWRSQPSLYKTAVSEFMLQQTRVTTVVPYFLNWLNEFPDFHTLANASAARVLKAWEGLGYYSRARNLHRLAKVAASWESPPDTIEEWKKLPGVGPYIAAAITSISLGQAEAVCDGNVVRVLSRIFAISESFKDGATAQKKIRPLAQLLLRTERPGDYNQGLMELGATVCHRSSPLCSVCPVLTHCKSGKSGEWNKFPSIIPKPKKIATIQRYWVENQDRILLYASIKGRLQSVFELPQKLPFHPGPEVTKPKILATRNRTIGNTDYNEEILGVTLSRDPPTTMPAGYQWMEWAEMKEITISGPHRKWINELKKTNDSI